MSFGHGSPNLAAPLQGMQGFPFVPSISHGSHGYEVISYTVKDDSGNEEIWKKEGSIHQPRPHLQLPPTLEPWPQQQPQPVAEPERRSWWNSLPESVPTDTAREIGAIVWLICFCTEPLVFEEDGEKRIPAIVMVAACGICMLFGWWMWYQDRLTRYSTERSSKWRMYFLLNAGIDVILIMHALITCVATETLLVVAGISLIVICCLDLLLVKYPLILEKGSWWGVCCYDKWGSEKARGQRNFAVAEAFEVGERVEIFSKSMSRWVSGRIDLVSPHDNYPISLGPNVEPMYVARGALLVQAEHGARIVTPEEIPNIVRKLTHARGHLQREPSLVEYR